MTEPALRSDHVADWRGFHALAITRTGRIELAFEPDKTFPLFTALGEKRWVPGWEPYILRGNGYAQGTVWVTLAREHTTYWTVTTYDPGAHRAQYVRITPTVSAGIVDIGVAATDTGGSVIDVTYRLTGLSPSGNADLAAAFSEDAFRRMLQQWQAWLTPHRDARA